MKHLYIVANWKANKTSSEAHAWLIQFLNQDLISYLHQNTQLKKTIIICPPFTLLSELAILFAQYDLPLSLGAQNVSHFPEGSHTGEESAVQLAEFAKYVIIGHSERREEFLETDELLRKKVDESKRHMLIPIYCVRSEKDPIPDGVTIVAYEPQSAIGSGKAELPSVANSVATKIKKINKISSVLYGGSVTPENVHEFTSQSMIDGVLVGTASLDPIMFSQIVVNA